MKYPKIGIRPTIDGRQGGVRESLEEKTMALAKAVAELITKNLRNGDGSRARGCGLYHHCHLMLVLRFRDDGHESSLPQSSLGL